MPAYKETDSTNKINDWNCNIANANDRTSLGNYNLKPLYHQIVRILIITII